MPFAARHGTRIHYETFGDGPCVVLLHPLSTSRFFWTDVMFPLAVTHRVVVPDLRGHGRSDRPPSGYGVPSLAADVLAVLDDAKAERAVWVGNSIGGMIAIEAAISAPPRVSGAVVVSATTNLGPLVPREALTAYEERFWAAWAYMSQGALSPRTRRERPEVAEYLGGAARAGGNFTPEVFLACMRDPDGVFRWNAEDRLGRVACPVAVFAGADDQTLPQAAVRALADRVPGASLRVVDEVGHYYPRERPAEFNADLRAFLALARGVR